MQNSFFVENLLRFLQKNEKGVLADDLYFFDHIQTGKFFIHPCIAFEIDGISTFHGVIAVITEKAFSFIIDIKKTNYISST